jgi:hypothetical protein
VNSVFIGICGGKPDGSRNTLHLDLFKLQFVSAINAPQAYIFVTVKMVCEIKIK